MPTRGKTGDEKWQQLKRIQEYAKKTGRKNVADYAEALYEVIAGGINEGAFEESDAKMSKKYGKNWWKKPTKEQEKEDEDNQNEHWNKKKYTGKEYRSWVDGSGVDWNDYKRKGQPSTASSNEKTSKNKTSQGSANSGGSSKNGGKGAKGMNVDLSKFSDNGKNSSDDFRKEYDEYEEYDEPSKKSRGIDADNSIKGQKGREEKSDSHGEMSKSNVGG